MSYDMPKYTRLSQVPGTAEYHSARSYIRGQGYIHVQDQVGTYSEWMEGGPERQAAFNRAKAAALAYTEPYRLGRFTDPENVFGRYTPEYAAAVQSVAAAGPTAPRSYLAAVLPVAMAQPDATRTAGTTASRAAGSSVAGGGTALARGGPAIGLTPGAGLDLSGTTSSISSAGASVINTATKYLPLAIKIGAALIGIKLLFWLIRGRRR